ncbi:MAG: hypothetical protein ACJZ9C_00665 [Dehalococcoidia bacterium]
MTSINNKKFKYITSIQKPLNDVFDFYSDPKNINKLTPWFAKVKAIPEKKLTPNAVFVIEINVFGLKNKWKISISNYEKNKIFTDIQLEGPFAIWEHTHIFEYRNNTTLMTDEIIYKSKISFFDKLNIFKYIFTLVFYYRKRRILSIFK